MAASPQWKVYSASGEYLAACKYAEDAAAFAAFRGKGTQVRHGHKRGYAVWIEGMNTADSYDAAAELMQKRLEGFLHPKPSPA